MKSGYAVILILLLVAATSMAGEFSVMADTTVISGSLSGILPPGVYHVQGAIWVPADSLLQIAAGTTFLFNENTWFDIAGGLSAQGSNRDIVFKPYPGHEDWGGVEFQDSADDNGVMRECEITGVGGTYGLAPLIFKQCNATADHCYIHDNDPYGMHIGGGITCDNANAIIVDCEIVDNSCGYGGGIHIRNSEPEISDCIITGNSTDYYGGGIYCSDSSPQIQNCSIYGNVANREGGGIYSDNSSPELAGVYIHDNIACGFGGGVYITGASIPGFDPGVRCDIYHNTAGCGSDLFTAAALNIPVFADTFSVAVPTDYHAYPLGNFTLYITTGLIPQENADLYVSPSGDDGNSGLSAGDPLKHVSCALSKIIADSLNPRTIHLAQGIYSYSANGTPYPLNMVGYVTLSGPGGSGAPAEAVLDAENLFTTIFCYNDKETAYENITITGGGGEADYYGGALHGQQSGLTLNNCSVSDNDCGGIQVSEQSELVIYSSTVSGNAETGVYCMDHSDLSIEESNVSGNISGYPGGGIGVSGQSGASITHCVVDGNQNCEGWPGIGVTDCDSTLVEVSYCTISNNIGPYGGIYSNNSSPNITRCVIDGNPGQSWAGGGGITSYMSSDTITYCTFYGNGGGQVCTGYFSDTSTPTIVNTIFHGDDLTAWVLDINKSEGTTIEYCDIYTTSNRFVTGFDPPDSIAIPTRGNANGDSCDNYMNILCDPSLSDPGNNDFRLSAGSPCTNAGDNSYPSDPEDAGLPDIGAYYFGQSGVKDTEESGTPSRIHLSQNYPNPFNPVTSIGFELPAGSNVRLAIYDLRGRLVATLVDGMREAGEHNVKWDASGCASGVYLYRLRTDDHVESARMLLIK